MLLAILIGGAVLALGVVLGMLLEGAFNGYELERNIILEDENEKLRARCHGLIRENDESWKWAGRLGKQLDAEMARCTRSGDTVVGY